MKSVQCIKKVIKEFADLSGLRANPAKSSFYCASVSPRMQEQLIEFPNMKEVSSTDYCLLLQKISGKIDFSFWGDE